MTGRCICITPRKGSVFQSSSSFLRACDFLVVSLCSLFSSRIRLLFSRTLFGEAREPVRKATADEEFRRNREMERSKVVRRCSTLFFFASAVPYGTPEARQSRHTEQALPDCLVGKKKVLSLSLPPSLFFSHSSVSSGWDSVRRRNGGYQTFLSRMTSLSLGILK